jgi:RTX calcium-binding nonapeptide repeat (4 copies)
MLAIAPRLALAVVMLWLLSAPAGAVTAGEKGRIAFERHAGADSDVMVVAWPDSQVTQMLLPGMEGSRQTDPAWAPIAFNPDPVLAFTSDVSGQDEIYVVDAQPGTEPVLKFNPLLGTEPAWASAWPDGTVNQPTSLAPIAFVRDGDVFVGSVDGSVITNVTATAAEESSPEWSMEGSELAFESTRSGKREIWAAHIGYQDGSPPSFSVSDLRRVTPDEPTASDPSWFQYRKLPADLPPDDGGEGPAQPGEPADCADGRTQGQCVVAGADRIAFSGLDVDGDEEIMFASYEQVPGVSAFADPSLIDVWALTDNGVTDAAPSWSPLGDAIVFARDTPTGSRLMLMDQDGEGPGQLTIDGASGVSDTDPAWEPLPFAADVIVRRPCGHSSRRRACRKLARTAAVPPCPPEVCPTPEPPVPQPTPPEPPARCTQSGTPGADVLRGTPGRDVLCGGGGDDRLIGDGGDDVLEGGPGRDVLAGGAGRDRLVGEAGDDRLAGGVGDDRLAGGSGADLLAGGSGADVLVGGPGRDRLLAGPGADRLDARDRGRDRVVGGGGRDRALIDGSRDRSRGIELLRR